MLKPFQIRDLHRSSSHDDLSGSSILNDHVIRSNHRAPQQGIVQLSASEYDEIATNHPRARLTYTDDDDGELITVGSSLELSQRLEEPIDMPSPMYLVPQSEQMHFFDIRRSNSVKNLWKKFEYKPHFEGPESPKEISMAPKATEATQSNAQGELSSHRENSDSAAINESEPLLAAFETELARIMSSTDLTGDNNAQSGTSNTELQPRTESSRRQYPSAALMNALQNLIEGAETISTGVRSRLPEFERQLQNFQRALPEHVGSSVQGALAALENQTRSLVAALNDTATARGQETMELIQSELPTSAATVEGLHNMASELGHMGHTLFEAFKFDLGCNDSNRRSQGSSDSIPNLPGPSNLGHTGSTTTTPADQPAISCDSQQAGLAREVPNETRLSSIDAGNDSSMLPESRKSLHTQETVPATGGESGRSTEQRQQSETTSQGSSSQDEHTRVAGSWPRSQHGQFPWRDPISVPFSRSEWLAPPPVPVFWPLDVPQPPHAFHHHGSIPHPPHHAHPHGPPHGPPPHGPPPHGPPHHGPPHHGPHSHGHHLHGPRPQRPPRHGPPHGLQHNRPPPPPCEPRLSYTHGPPLPPLPPGAPHAHKILGPPPCESHSMPRVSQNVLRHPYPQAASSGVQDRNMNWSTLNDADHVPNSTSTDNGDKTALFIGNVAFSATESTVRNVFASGGFIVDVHLPLDSETGRHAGFGYLHFPSIHAARAALDALQGFHIDGHSINLEFSDHAPIAMVRTTQGRGEGVLPNRCSITAPPHQTPSPQRINVKGKTSAINEQRPAPLKVSDLCSADSHQPANEASSANNSLVSSSLLDTERLNALYPPLSEGSTPRRVASHTAPTQFPDLSRELEESRFPPVSQLDAHFLAENRREAGSSSDTPTEKETPAIVTKPDVASEVAPQNLPGAFPQDPQSILQEQPESSTAAHVTEPVASPPILRPKSMRTSNLSRRLSGPWDGLRTDEFHDTPRSLRRRATERQSLRDGAIMGPRSIHGRRPFYNVSPRPSTSTAEYNTTGQRRIDDCVSTLANLGYGSAEEGGLQRIAVYAAAVDGRVSDAIEMIEEERKAYEQQTK
ncbi:hypothetical protein BDV25DRAFT_148341 [Aspergillus avenaceus]|uniref:RRM domain-containing protein n=1 Tax=Aspergillus avenaceus TaxID=36643 RepID=A0A5N6U5R0_ASPAV|nr:hypothetical protein BDV25DRAFT_148341 [Aspergillus avenaceus]